MESPNLYVRLWLKIFLLELFRSRRSWGNRTLSPDLRDPSRPGFKIRGAVERVLSGAERTAPAPLRSIYFFILRSTAPLQVIFWIQSGSLLQNCQKGALTPCSRCWSNMWAFRALLLNFRSTAPLRSKKNSADFEPWPRLSQSRREAKNSVVVVPRLRYVI